jgi:hypothetical protein
MSKRQGKRKRQGAASDETAEFQVAEKANERLRAVEVQYIHSQKR